MEGLFCIYDEKFPFDYNQTFTYSPPAAAL